MSGVIGNSVAYWDSWNFVVEVDGKPIAGFQKVTGIGVEFGISQFLEAGVPGVSSQSHGAEKPPKDVTMERGEAGDAYFWNWRDSINDGNVDDLRNFTIVQKHGAKAKERIKLENCGLGGFEPGDFDRGADDKKRITKTTLKPQRLKREAV